MQIFELYDDLTAIRRTANSQHEHLPQEVRDDLQVVLERIRGKLRAEMRAMSEDALEELDMDYAGEASGELRELLGN